MLSPSPSEYGQLLEFLQCHNSLLQEDKYIARSDYVNMVEEYASINTFFRNQKTATTLENYCEKFRIPLETIEEFLFKYEDLSNSKEGSISIQQHN